MHGDQLPVRDRETDTGINRLITTHSSNLEVSLVWEVEKYKAPEELVSKILTRASKKPLQGLPIKRLDHINLLAADVGATRAAYQDVLGYRRTEGLVNGNVEVGAWLSTNLLSHEIAIMRDALGANGRLHHVAFYYGT